MKYTPEVIEAMRRLCGAATVLYDEASNIERKLQVSGIREKLTAADVVSALHDRVWALSTAETQVKPTPDEALRALRDSLDADVLRDDYPRELVEQELRAAGCDPAELVARTRPKIDAMLEARRASLQTRARESFGTVEQEAPDRVGARSGAAAGAEQKPRETRVSIEIALASSAQFLESLLAENLNSGQRIRLEAALEGAQRAIAFLADSVPDHVPAHPLGIVDGAHSPASSESSPEQGGVCQPRWQTAGRTSAATAGAIDLGAVPLARGAGWLIVETSNFGNSGETPGRDETLIAAGIPDRVAADNMCQALNERCSGDEAPHFYKVEPAGYALKEFRP